MRYAKCGSLGRKFGVEGGKFGRLGGRPRVKKDERLLKPEFEDAFQKSRRKNLSSTSKRDDSFGVMARLDVCDVVKRLRPVFEGHNLSEDDMYVHLSDKTGRTKAKLVWAVKHEEKWREQQKLLRLENDCYSHYYCYY